MSDEPYNNDAGQQDAATFTGDALGAFDTPLPGSGEAPAHGFKTIPTDEPIDTPRMSEEGWPILFDDEPAETGRAKDASDAAFGDALSQWDSFQTSDATSEPTKDQMPHRFTNSESIRGFEDLEQEPVLSKRRKRKKAKAARAEEQAASEEQAPKRSKNRRNKTKAAQSQSGDNQANQANAAASVPLPGAFVDSDPNYAANLIAEATAKHSTSPQYDFLWEDEAKRSAKGDVKTTTVVESDTDYLLLPHPDVFNAYPPEVQRKIMEWADRDVRARRDDESLRQDALIRAQAARERMMMAVPVAIVILCIVCAAITGLFTRSAVFVVAFLIVAVAVILAIYFTRKNDLYAHSVPTDEEEAEE